MNANVSYDNFNHLSFIGVYPDYKYLSLIIDTNVVIMLERFYYTPHKLASMQCNAIVQFLFDTMYTDIAYGPGMHEACWDNVLGNINEAQQIRIITALNNIWSWSKKEIIKHSNSQGIISDVKVERKAPIQNKSRLIGIEFNPVQLLSTYAVLLKIHLLNKRKSSEPKMLLFRELVEFMDTELSSIHAIELFIAFDYFLGRSSRSEYVQQLLKFGSYGGLNTIWGSTWDIFFLRYLQASSYDAGYKLPQPKLVTADKALAKLADYVFTMSIAEEKKVKAPILMFYFDEVAPSVNLEEVNDLMSNLFESTKRRFGNLDSEKFYSKVKCLVDYLEKEYLFNARQ